MKLLNHTKRQSIFYKFLFSYIIILLIPLVIIVGTYFGVRTMVEDTINRANEAVLRQIKNSIDWTIMEGIALALQTGSDSKVLSSSNNDATFMKIDHFNDYQINQQLKQLAFAHSSFSNIFVYYNNSKTILSKDNKLDSKSFYEQYYKTDQIGYDEWERIMKSNSFRDIVSLVTKEGKKTIAITQAFPLNFRNNHYAKVVVCIDYKQLETMIQDIEWLNKGTMGIYDKDNGLLITSGVDYPSIDINQYKEDHDFYYDTINGKRYVIKIFNSENTGCKYVSVVPYDVFWENIHYFNGINFIGIILILLSGGVMAYALTRKNYNPVKLIIDQVSERTQIYFDYKKDNELEFINTVLNLNINEKKELKQRLKSGKEILRENFLRKVLQGIGLSASIETFMQYEIEFESTYFAVLLIHIENNREDDIAWYYDEEQTGLLGFIIRNIMEEMADMRNRGVVVGVDQGSFACILNFKDSNSQKVFDCTNLAKEFQEFLKQRFKISTTIAISGIHRDIQGIHKAYIEALDTIEYKMVFGKDRIIPHQSIEKRISTYNYNNKTEQKLMLLIKNCNTSDQIGVGVQALFEENLINGSASIEMIKAFIYNLVSIFGKIISEIGLSNSIDKNQYIVKLITCETLVDFRETLKCVLMEVSNQIGNENNHNILSEAVMEYIDNNYFDTEINISTIAERYNISPYYLSTLFKEHSGESILDYLAKIRINKAKQLLKDTDDTISNIGNKIGFSSSSVFIRTFKKHEKITPGEYRQL